jgi:hypothetical protein
LASILTVTDDETLTREQVEALFGATTRQTTAANFESDPERPRDQP